MSRCASWQICSISLSVWSISWRSWVRLTCRRAKRISPARSLISWLFVNPVASGRPRVRLRVKPDGLDWPKRRGRSLEFDRGCTQRVFGVVSGIVYCLMLFKLYFKQGIWFRSGSECIEVFRKCLLFHWHQQQWLLRERERSTLGRPSVGGCMCAVKQGPEL